MESHYKVLLQVIKYIIDTRYYGLKYDLRKIKVNNLSTKWDMEAYCDSDYAGDKESRKSVTGYGVYLQGCLIAWKSRGQKTVSLSSSEVEYLAIADVCTEITFIRNLLCFLGVEIDYPIVVRFDNIGAIFLGYNAKTSQCTKHVDIKAHFIREYVDQGIVKIFFCQIRREW